MSFVVEFQRDLDMNVDIPSVAIIGRPNVGKSSLFNVFIGKRISIVDPTSGVTRDRISTIMSYKDREFELIDTGGIGVVDRDDLSEDIQNQIHIALHSAEVIVFLVDVREGICPLDEEVARLLRPLGKKVVLAANKADFPKLEKETTIFYKLGFGNPIPISAKQRINTKSILDELVKILPESKSPKEKGIIKLAIVGKRNSGKSTLINTLANENRTIVSEIPGTTRDSVDVQFEIDGRRFVAIDTAGIRKRKSVKDSIEFYSHSRAKASIRRADAILFLLDCEKTISQVDKKVSYYIVEKAKPCIITVNKWDIAGDVKTEEFTRYISQQLSNLSFAPISFISALKGTNVKNTINLAIELVEQSNIRITTGKLNRIMIEAFSKKRPRRKKSKKPKMFYSTQVKKRPPTFVIFVNDKKLFPESYKRFLCNFLRDKLKFKEIPLKIFFRNRE